LDIRIRLLGRFELTCDGAVVVDSAWRPAKAAAMLKMLALRPGRSMHRDQLIAALWPEADAEGGTNSLYKNLHELRKTVRKAGGPRDVIHLVHPAISLAPYVRTDLEDVHARTATVGADATRDELASLLELCGEPLLPDDLYEPWTEPHRGDLQQQTARLRIRLAALHLEARAIDDAIVQYRAVLAADDVSEEAHRGLMRAYLLQERRDLALRQYERCREVLAAELDTVPSDETEALATEIRHGNPRSRIDEAVDEPARAGDAAMRRHAWEEAVAAYRTAIEHLRAAGHDPRRECLLWLKRAPVVAPLA
jgi:DNA-binding SARP family transcriptional activator